jgi:hypothetical protein
MQVIPAVVLVVPPCPLHVLLPKLLPSQTSSTSIFPLPQFGPMVPGLLVEVGVTDDDFASHRSDRAFHTHPADSHFCRSGWPPQLIALPTKKAVDFMLLFRLDSESFLFGSSLMENWYPFDVCGAASVKLTVVREPDASTCDVFITLSPQVQCASDAVVHWLHFASGIFEQPVSTQVAVCVHSHGISGLNMSDVSTALALPTFVITAFTVIVCPGCGFAGVTVMLVTARSGLSVVVIWKFRSALAKGENIPLNLSIMLGSAAHADPTEPKITINATATEIIVLFISNHPEKVGVLTIKAISSTARLPRRCRAR